MDTATIQTSGRLFEIVEDELPFEPYKKVNGIGGQYMEIEHTSDDEDGTFPRISDYTKLINRMDNDGVGAWLTWVGRSKTKIDYSYCTIERLSKYSGEAKLHFKKPIVMVFGKVGKEMVTREVSVLVGEFTYRWFWMKNGRQKELANGFEIYFEITSIES